MDCSGTVTSVDSLKVLRKLADLPVAQNEPCPNVGADIGFVWGDIDCSGNVTSVDSLKILRYVAGLPVAQWEPCTGIGSALSP